ncbi:hypothetical protein ACOZ4L_15580 (plasmid) [Haloplanus ruber]|uniref:DUF4013 domain-containing protein n=1 Tax=Haloplanus ruber TaxID=869892 RepID=A0ABD6CX82_9EURY|nr:hypothetical protein [Haloplanus ruber]
MSTQQSEQKEEQSSPTLWLDGLATGLGFGWLTNRLSWSVPPSYLYVVVTVIPLSIWSAAYKIYIGAPTVYSINPYFVLQPILLLGAAWGSHTLKRDYDQVVADMKIPDRASNPKPFINIIPTRLPWILFVIAAGIQFLPGAKVTDGWVLADYVFNYFVFPFVYTPILIQFFTVYLSIQLLAPWRLAKSDVGIHFLDPQGVGGLRPLGELIKKAYYFIVAGLVGYSLITYAPFVDTWAGPPATITNIVFTSVWLISIGTVAFAVFVLHRFMHREKREEIRHLEEEYRSHIEEPWDVKQYEIPEEHEETVTDIEDRIARVNATSEYPATFSIWSQLLLSVAIPKTLQLLLS